ncbi:polyhydroxybutyrate depolymerase [Gemmobacter aquarius]|uniref:Polyhydroxybutyrate depolymerase n=1 Tax=Paragemmobacter aquarius TaxID=2169400 RepID=A0A2S0UNL4_9RHOB|nr:PHB depolymerase family esterase [Gemmobacter aquarius]AWB49381.1 polyhydroxybutyrate depolymerase [Gemmobacter aquarius]
MNTIGFGLAIGLALALVASAAKADCNGAAVACEVPGGTYHIVLPEGAKGPVPAIILLHGYGGEGLGTIRNKAMVSLMSGRGYAVIAPDGQRRSSGAGRTWDFHPDRPATRDEIGFLISVADDAAAKYGLDRSAMLLAGFSIGGSMTSYLACARPDAFAAYAPVAGSFWRPHPAGCAGPVRLLHTHGTADTTVPLLGREVAKGFEQGNVFEAIEIWRITDRCTSVDPDVTQTRTIYTIRRWSDCAPGAELDFALHDGGHSIPKGWAKMAMDWFETPP